MEERKQSVFKVFIGSPGDVETLRKAAFELIKRLSEDEWRPAGLVVEGYGWDVTHYPKLANVPPQVNINRQLPDMAEYDLCLFIIGTRLGTPLEGDNFAPLADGRQPTGTEYEFNTAIALDDGPTVLVYHREKPPSIDYNATPEEQTETLQQFQLAQAFIKGISQDTAGHYIGDTFRFQEDEQFSARLDQDLKRLVKDRMPPAAAAKPQVASDSIPASVPAAYLRWLQKELPDLSLKGMKPRVAHRVRLPDIYVPALVMARQDVRDPRPDRTSMERRGQELLAARLDRESLYVSGAAGSGKTTFCLWLCWLISEGQLLSDVIEAPQEYQAQLPVDLMGRLPLLCRLRDFWGHMDCEKDNGNWSRHQLQQGLVRWLDTKGPDGLSGQDFLQWLAQGRCLLILDGFDEVPERHQTATGFSYPRATLLSGLARSLSDWQQAGNRVLLTSRPYGLNDTERRQLGLDESPLQPLPAELQQLFIQRWYHTTHGEEGRSIAAALWQYVKERNEAWLDDLACNPLLLTALCVKFSEGQTLPTDQHELFDAVVENTLYNRYRTHAGEILPVRRRLEAVAWGMQSGQVLDMEATCPVAEIRQDQVDALLAHHAEQNPLSEAGSTTAARRRNELLIRSGLLLPQGTDQAGFYHLMFQDFFAAEYALRNPAISVSELLTRHAADPRWHPMLILLLSGLNRRSNGIDGPLNTFGEVLRPGLKADALAEQALPAILWGRCLELAHTQVKDLGALGEEYIAACDVALEVVEEPEQRSRLFDSLARIGLDHRPGVGLNADGVPDIEWLEIPAGDFIYGEAETEQTLHLDTFCISRYPVTNVQYQAFVDDGGYDDPQWWHEIKSIELAESAWNESNRPRETVNWFEAVAYCRWLSQRLNRTVSLPTEQQWEKAARGSDGRDYPWGKVYESGRANVNETRFGGGSDNLQQTSAVGLYPRGAAPSGAMDMAGNVSEWCVTKSGEPATARPDIRIDMRVLRGGSWFDCPDDALSADRSGGYPLGRLDRVGFRVSGSGPLNDR